MTDGGLFPFVRLIEAPGVEYPEGERFAAAISAQRDRDLRIRERRMSSPTTGARESVEKHRGLPVKSTVWRRRYPRGLGIRDLCPLAWVELVIR